MSFDADRDCQCETCRRRRLRVATLPHSLTPEEVRELVVLGATPLCRLEPGDAVRYRELAEKACGIYRRGPR